MTPRKRITRKEWSEYEGREVSGIEASIRKTGDGLSESMKVAPFPVHQGDKVCIVIRAVCVDVQHPVEDRKAPDEGSLVRVQVFDAQTAAFIDDDVVSKALDAQEARNAARREEERREKERERGIQTFDDLEDDESE